MDINLFKIAWCRETAHPSYQKEWSENNPSCGQCAVTALIVNELCCAPIYKCRVGLATHYYNMWPGRHEIIDFTGEQFGNIKINYLDGEHVLRSQLLKCKHVRERYELLKSRMEVISCEQAC